MASSTKNRFRQKNPRNKQTKFHLVFDEEHRNDFLTGFHKRKEARKKKAKQEIERKQKEERSKAKEEKRKYIKEQLYKLQRTSGSYGAFDGLMKSSDSPVVYNHPEHTVTVTSVTDINLTENFIGPNEVKYSGDEQSEAEESNAEEPETKTEVKVKKVHQLKRKKKMIRFMKLQKKTKQLKAKRKKEKTGQKKPKKRKGGAGAHHKK